MHTVVAAIALLLLGARAQTNVTVNLAQTYQTMDGFGASEAFGHANHLYQYPAAQQKQVLDLLYNVTTGAGMTILRNRIGSGGQGDSILPTGPSSPSGTPNYVWDGTDGQQVRLSKQAMSYGVTTFYADAWSAPGFMKTNGRETNGGWLCGVTGHTCSSGDWKQAYANFLVKYIQLYAQEGVTVTHVGFLNEPEYVPTYSSMQSDGTQAADFIKVLYPTLQKANLTTQITCCDAEGWNYQQQITPQLKSAGVENMLGVITSHAYSSQVGSAISTTRRVWQTEYADLNGSLNPNNWYSNGGAGEGMTWANYIWAGIVNANLSAYLYWIGAEPGNTNSALILTSGTTTTASKRLWAFGQWSRYVRPGAVRLGTTGSGSNLRFSAFRNPDGRISVQVLNNGGSAVTINANVNGGFTPRSVQAFVSAQGTDLGPLTVTLNGNGVATASVPAHGMATFVFVGDDGSTSTTPTTTTTTTTTSTTTTTTSRSTTTTTTSRSTSTGGCTVSKYGQCGGSGYTGCTTCAAGSTCVSQNQWYSQCL